MAGFGSSDDHRTCGRHPPCNRCIAMRIALQLISAASQTYRSSIVRAPEVPNCGGTQ